MKELKKEVVGSSSHQTLSKLSAQIEVIRQCGRQMSSSAESLGAVAYESRMSAAVKMLVLYVDHVKRKWEKEHYELDEIKRILTESGVNVAKCLSVLPHRQTQVPFNHHHYRWLSLLSSSYASLGRVR